MDKDIVEGVKWVIRVECDHVLRFFHGKENQGSCVQCKSQAGCGGATTPVTRRQGGKQAGDDKDGERQYLGIVYLVC